MFTFWKKSFIFFRMSDINKEIGKRVEATRRAVNLNQTELGKELGIGKTAVSKYENGDTERGVPIEALIRIAQIGGRSLDWLITGKEPPAPQQASNDDVLYLALASKPEVLEKVREKVREEVREEQEAYAAERRQFPLTDRERELVANYKHASAEIQEEAFGMLERSARRSRRNAGGGSGSAERTSA